MSTGTLRVLREVNNYTQEFVAEEILGISQNTYSRLEQNPGRITADQAQKLSGLYGVSMANLLSDLTPMITFIHPPTNEKERAGNLSQGWQIRFAETSETFLKDLQDVLLKQCAELRQIGEAIKNISNLMAFGFRSSSEE